MALMSLFVCLALPALVYAVGFNPSTSTTGKTTTKTTTTTKPSTTPSTTTTTPSTTGSTTKSTTKTKVVPPTKYDLSFTLPSAGLSGCTVCHADPGIIRKDAKGKQSIYVDPNQFMDGPHRELACTSCHSDFASKKGHDAVASSDTWRDVAKLSCKNCHKEQYSAMMSGVHTIATQTKGVVKSKTAAEALSELAVAAERSKNTDLAGKSLTGRKTPLCGDCHDGHTIMSFKDNKEYRAQYRANAIKLCGSSECHPDEAASYMDPYHGAAAHRGSSSAPTCWDCHGTHGILNSKELYSKTNVDNLADTCKTCHLDASGDYVSYAKAIHGYQKTLDSNTAFVTVRSAFGRIADAIETFIKSLKPVSKGPAQ